MRAPLKNIDFNRYIINYKFNIIYHSLYSVDLEFHFIREQSRNP